MTLLNLKMPSLKILMEIKLVLSIRVSCAPVSTPFGDFCSWQISTIWLVSNPSLSTLSNDNNWIAQIAQITQLQSAVKYHLLSNLSDWLHARGLLYVKQLVTKAVINFQILFLFLNMCRSGLEILLVRDFFGNFDYQSLRICLCLFK